MKYIFEIVMHINKVFVAEIKENTYNKLKFIEEYLTDIFKASSQKIIFFIIFNDSFYKKENSLVFFLVYIFETKN